MSTLTPVSNSVARSMEVEARLEGADAIVVLGAAVYPDGTLTNASLRRATHGIALFRQGLAPRIVFAGVRLIDGPSEAAVRLRLARAMGILGESILTEEGARTTREEAIRIASLLHPARARRILLVTGSHHMRRARPLFERRGFEVLPAPVDEIGVQSESPGARLLLTQTILAEVAARLYYRRAGCLLDRRS